MKKIILSLALSVGILASCQVVETDGNSHQNIWGDFIAYTEDFDLATRTSLTETNRVVWSAGDEIVVFQGNTLGDKYSVSDVSAGTSNGVFSIVKVPGVTDGDFTSGTELSRNVALYPYNDGVVIDNLLDSDNDEVVAYVMTGVEIPAVQNYAENSFANGAFPMVAVTVDMPDHNLKFNNVIGAIKLRFKGSDRVKNIKIVGNNGEKLSGEAVLTVWFEEEKKPTIAMFDDAGTSVTLDCGEGVQLSASESTVFILALPPTDFTSGFKVTITNTDGVEKVIETTTENSVLRSSILTMPELTLGVDYKGALRNYIDEYGVNHGIGVEIDGVIWAPVNCGYHETDYPYGKHYQWGRKYGQGFDLSDASVPTIGEGNVSLEEGQSEANKNVFFAGFYDWLYTPDPTLWNIGTEGTPIKNTDNDPCPKGWRVPTYSELVALSENYSDWDTNGANQNGRYFSGLQTYTPEVPQIFLPAAGDRDFVGDIWNRGNDGHYWSSTPYNEYALKLAFENNTASMYFNPRVYAYTIRCVQE